MADADTLKAFRSAIMRADAVDKTNKALQNEFKARLGKLAGAVKDGDVPMMQLMRGQLATTVGKAEECLHEIDDLLRTDVDKLRRDQAFADEKGAQIETLVGKVSASQAALTRQYDTAQQLDTATEKALKAQENSKGKALRDFADLERRVATRVKELAAMNTQSSELAKQAILAYADHAADALETARKKIEALGIPGELKAAELLDADVDYLLKRWKGQGFGDDADAQFDEIAKKLREKIDDTRAWIKQSASALDNVRGYKLGKADVGKAMDVLELPDGAKSKLAKALELPFSAMARALDAIAKEFKLKASGKAMVDDLRKGNVF